MWCTLVVGLLTVVGPENPVQATTVPHERGIAGLDEL